MRSVLFLIALSLLDTSGNPGIELIATLNAMVVFFSLFLFMDFFELIRGK